MESSALGGGVEGHVILVHFGRCRGKLAFVTSKIFRFIHHWWRNSSLLLLDWILQSEGRNLSNFWRCPELTLKLLKLHLSHEIVWEVRQVWQIGQIWKIGKTWWELWQESREHSSVLFSPSFRVLWPTLVAEWIQHWHLRVWAAIIIENHGGLVVVLLEVELQGVTVLGSIRAVCATVLVDIGVRLHVTVQHGLVNTAVIAMSAFEGLGAVVVPQVVLEMVLVLGHKNTFWAEEKLLWLDMSSTMLPEL